MPDFFIIAGPNGAGKSTVAKDILPAVGCENFINADEIARGLNPLYPEKVPYAAGKLMLETIKKYQNERKTFGIETTLSGKVYLKIIEDLKKQGYKICLIYIYLSSDKLAIKRVKSRVADGGHNIPETTIKRRYIKGLQNLTRLYWSQVDNLLIFNNINKFKPVYSIARMDKGNKEIISDKEIYQQIQSYKK